MGDGILDAGLLITFRVLQGLFGALMLPQGLGMLKQIFSEKEQAVAFGAFGPVMGLSSVGGPILAGWLVDANYFGSGWRMIFLINVPLGLFAVLGALTFLPDSRSPQTPRLDVLGVLFAAEWGDFSQLATACRNASRNKGWSSAITRWVLATVVIHFSQGGLRQARPRFVPRWAIACKHPILSRSQSG